VTERRRRFLLSAVAVLVVSIAGGWLLSRAREDSGSVDAVLTLTPGSTSQDPTIGTNAANTGKVFPTLQLETLSGQQKSIGGPSITGPLVVNFWFSTCEPCKREMPALVAAHKKYGIDIIGVNPRDSADAARSFADEFGVDYEVLRDPNGASLATLGIGTFPMTYLVAANGMILEQHAGEITPAELDAMLTPLSDTRTTGQS